MSPSSTESTLINNPYVGPRTFETRHKNLFFGREREARDLVSLVIAEPLVLFTAQSGAGKSSLINTRLIPSLEENNFEVLPVGRVGGGAQFEGISQVDNIYTFNLLLSLDKGERPPQELAPLTLDDYLQKTKAPPQPKEPGNESKTASKQLGRVLIIDQFEEIVTTHHSHWPARERFFHQLNNAIHNDPFLWVVLTMREDYVASLDPYLPLLDDQLRTRFYMQRMEISAAREAIEKPAARRDRPFSPDVTNVLIDNLRQLRIQGHTTNSLGQYIEPVQLQVVCYQLWANLDDQVGDTITMADVERALGHLEEAVDSALGQYYEQALAFVRDATQTSELTLRNWFEQHLITPSQTRGTVYRGEKEAAGLSNTAVTQLDRRFLLRTERRAGAVWYELVHDRFIEPILQSNHEWRLQQEPVLLAADKWDYEQRPAALLYEGNQLDEALVSQAASDNPLVQEFLQASQRAAEAKRVESQREQAAEQAARAEKEQRNRQRVQNLFYSIVIFLILGLIATAASFIASNLANTNRDLALMAQETAEAGQVAAQTASALDRVRQGEAEEAKSTADAQLAIVKAAEQETANQQATAVAAQANTVAQQATAEAAEANTVVQQATAEAAQQDSAAQQATAEAALDHVEAQKEALLAQSLAFQALNISRQSNNAELAMLLLLEAAAINENFNDPQVNELIQRSLLPLYEQTYFNTTLVGHEGQVSAIAFTSNGAQLVSAGVDGTIRIWPLNRPGQPEEIITDNVGTVDFIDISADGQTIAAANRDGSIRIWRLNRGNTPLTFNQREEVLNPKFFEINDLALSPNGDALAVAVVDTDNLGTLTVWRGLTTGNPRPATSTATNPTGFEQLVFTADNRRLYGFVPSETAPRVSAWDVNNPRTSLINDLASLPLLFSPDGSRILYDTGSVTLENRTTAFINSETAITGSPASFAADGSMLAAVNGTTINLWQLGRADILLTASLNGHQGVITDVAIAPDRQTIASASSNGAIRIWRPNTAATAFTPGTTYMALAGDQLVYAQNTAVQIASVSQIENLVENLTVLEGLTNQTQAIALSPDGRQLVIGGGGSNGGTLTSWDLQNPAAPTTYNRAHLQQISALAFSTDGQWLASGSGQGANSTNDDTIRLWNPADLSTPIAEIPDQGSRILGLAFVPQTDTPQFISINNRNGVRLWQMGDQPSSWVNSWSADLPQPPATLAISPDGRWLAVGDNDDDGTLYVWDLHDLSLPFLLFAGHRGSINTVTFTPDGNTVLSAGEDGTIRLWQPETPSTPAVILRGHAQPVNALTYTAEGVLLSVDNAQTLIWESLDEFLATGCTLVQRNLTASEWQLYLEDDRPYNQTCEDYPEHYTATQ